MMMVERITLPEKRTSAVERAAEHFAKKGYERLHGAPWKSAPPHLRKYFLAKAMPLAYRRVEKIFPPQSFLRGEVRSDQGYWLIPILVVLGVAALALLYLGPLYTLL